MTDKTWPISEVFGPVAQGEGALVGQRTMFVRVGGCDGADGKAGWCQWCDSLFSVDPKYKDTWTHLSTDDIMNQLHELAPYCKNVTISGGNPALYDMSELVERLHAEDYKTNCETQGTVFKPWLCDLTTLTISPKPPSAGFYYSPPRLGRFLMECEAQTLVKAGPPIICVKIVCNPDADDDRAFVETIAQQARFADGYPLYYPLYISCLTHADDTRDELLARYARLEEWVMHNATLCDCYVGFQSHVATHGHGRKW